MIIFLNFAPIDFMGGAEKWMMDMASRVNKNEETVLVDVSPSIANIYGKLVLNRNFNSHMDKNKKENNRESVRRITLTFSHFLPYTKQWMETRNLFKEARLVYIKYDLLEVLINLYFSDWSNTKKTITGLHSPFIYKEPVNSFDRLHNAIYHSVISKYYLSKVKKVHVLNQRDEQFFKKIFKLNNVVRVPNSVQVPKIRSRKTDKKTLQILFVGELSSRKGVDTLISIIKEAREYFIFHIAGDGPMKKEIIQITKENTNCKYYGYLKGDKLAELYLKSDVLLFPSRAESLSLVMLEAIAYGLPVVDSKEVRLQLPSYIETSVAVRSPKDYIKALESIYKHKIKSEINNNKIQQYASHHFSNKILYPIFAKLILSTL